ncbi:hypothetical protein PI124_g14174 [Phytophthora idaei]|nr:hypothetical protein PI125_g12869 [Phytophthora idaei]KAG3149618.1 hypothetical protein PI126_g11931 [Phytophthora idaei]KAG3240949.1 hypothetical protein PI124_g14174 [Phytophthora idaei]
MTPEKAIIEAARLGQEERLDQLLTKYVCRVPYALVAAAAHGHLNCVELLLKKYFDHTRVNLSFDEWNLVQKAAKDAGGNEHLCVLKCLLSGFYAVSPGVTPMYMCYLASPAAFDALDAAAVNGHLDVVRYIVPHVKDKKYVHGTMAAGILAHAISARHMDVVGFLFGLDSSWWDLVEAFIVSVDLKQYTLAGSIFDAHRREAKGDLLVKVAGRTGSIQAVK